jgi:hypothetical protein
METNGASLINDTVYFNMNIPEWFMNKSLKDKCDIVKALAKDLETEKPITPQELDELLPVK